MLRRPEQAPSVKQSVPRLAARLGKQCTRVAGCQVQRIRALTAALDAKWVRGAPPCVVERRAHNGLESARTTLSDETTHGSLGVAGRRVDEHSRHGRLRRALAAVDAFAQRRTPVTAFKTQSANQDVREHVKDEERRGEEWRLATSTPRDIIVPLGQFERSRPAHG
jgi:hypothetical protein